MFEGCRIVVVPWSLIMVAIVGWGMVRERRIREEQE
jgi:hypothetical protein